MSNVGGVRSNDPYASVGGTEAPETASAASGQAVSLASDLFKGKSALAEVAGGSGEVAFGARGEGARLVQQALVQLKLIPPPADGVFGRNTQSAVAAFQREAGLSPSGNVDSATLAALDAKIASAGGASSTAAPKPSGPVDNSLVFVGMGVGAKDEAKNFASRTATTAITDTKVNDQVSLKVGGQTKTYDLTKKEGCDSYVRDIGLTGAKADEVSKIILGAGDDARDETAQLAKVFKEGQDGKRNIERFAISGHSVGSGVWGDENGWLNLSTIGDLAKAFPAAARQVEDFGYHGCYSGGESNMDKFRTIFPNLKTAWAYSHSAPGTYSGALVHENRWEAATRGHDPSKVQMSLAAGTRKGENVATWNAVSGYQSDAPVRTLDELRRDYESGRTTVGSFFSGNQDVGNTQEGPVREHYNSIQHLLQSPQLPPAERTTLEAARDQVIRLNFYDASVKGKFQAAHAPKIAAGFAAVGLPAPDFSKLSRKEALQQISAFEAKLNGMNPKPAAAQTLKPLLTDGLRDLRTSQIPNTWV